MDRDYGEPSRVWPVFMGLLLFLGAAQCALVLVHVWDSPVDRAIMGMGTSLFVVWVLLGGAVMRHQRERVRHWTARASWPAPVVFSVFATGLALTEEAITVTLTNMAPLFGVAKGEAFITASANYLEVVLLHSVVVFAPMFVAWGFLLRRYAVPPRWVFLLFGVTGVLAETMAFGPRSLLAFGLWIPVYGLLVYLPAYCYRPPKPRIPFRPWCVPLAVFLPILAAMPVVAALLALRGD